MMGLTDENEAGIDAINAALIRLRQTVVCRAYATFRGAAPSRFDAETHRHTHHVGNALDGELLQNPRAMNLDGARTDAEAAADLFVRSAGDQLLKHIALTPCEAV